MITAAVDCICVGSYVIGVRDGVFVVGLDVGCFDGVLVVDWSEVGTPVIGCVVNGDKVGSRDIVGE